MSTKINCLYPFLIVQLYTIFPENPDKFIFACMRVCFSTTMNHYSLRVFYTMGHHQKGEIGTIIAITTFVLLSVATAVTSFIAQNTNQSVTTSTQASSCVVGQTLCDIPACNASLGGNPGTCPACNGGWCRAGVCATCGNDAPNEPLPPPRNAPTATPVPSNTPRPQSTQAPDPTDVPSSGGGNNSGSGGGSNGSGSGGSNPTAIPTAVPTEQTGPGRQTTTNRPSRSPSPSPIPSRRPNDQLSPIHSPTTEPTPIPINGPAVTQPPQAACSGNNRCFDSCGTFSDRVGGQSCSGGKFCCAYKSRNVIELFNLSSSDIELASIVRINYFHIADTRTTVTLDKVLKANNGSGPHIETEFAQRYCTPSGRVEEDEIYFRLGFWNLNRDGEKTRFNEIAFTVDCRQKIQVFQLR